MCCILLTAEPRNCKPQGLDKSSRIRSDVCEGARQGMDTYDSGDSFPMCGESYISVYFRKLIPYFVCLVV